MTIPLIFYLLDILYHTWHPTNVSLANTYTRHHLSAQSAWRVITSYCCSCINHACNLCRETLSPQTSSQGKCSFQYTKPQTRDLLRLQGHLQSTGSAPLHPPASIAWLRGILSRACLNK